MSKIKQLPPHEAQKIAAGQVVDRPANIVKELIENTIDAQATQITIFIEDGGKKLIRIVDNGCGMSYEDAQLCFAKHATSKIEHIDELQSIETFGFRGEALASIGAVSHVTLITKEANASHGNKIYHSEGATKSIEQVAATTGTDIAVHNLFYNLPARAKFLKRRETEWRHILQLVHAFCLDYPAIHIKLYSEGSVVLNCPPTKNIADRFAQLGNHTATHKILNLEITRKDKNITITGGISNHHTFRYDRSTMFFFVNKRWVTNHHLQRALLKGYQNVLPQGRYPMACISITIDPHVIDINIHPRKEEIQFVNPRVVEQLLEQAVKQTLEEHLSVQLKREVTIAANVEQLFEQPIVKSRSSHKIQYSPFDFNTYVNNIATNRLPPTQLSKTPLTPTVSQNETPSNNTQQSIVTPQQETTTYSILSQLNKTYILIEQEDGLFLVDQHAAQERILYELFAKRFKQAPTVQLLFPQQITLSADDMENIQPHLTIFHDNGIQIEPFGADQLLITSTPVHLKNVALEDLIKQVISWINEYQQLDTQTFFKTINEKLHAQMACKAAVKAGDTLTDEQMQQLLNDLHSTPNRFTCPHGRPTGWLLSFYEIEKKFKRKL